jgi:hypothetical protein
MTTTTDENNGRRPSAGPAQEAFRGWRFQLLIGFTVLIVSFAYGVAHGLSKKTPPASAALGRLDDPTEVLNSVTLPIPPGTIPVPIGRDLAVNGRPTQMVSFITARSVKAVLNEQVQTWQSQGLNAVGATSARRGVAIAMNKTTGERFSIAAWEVPPSYRKTISRGYPVQGFLSSAGNDRSDRATADEQSGLVPGVPIMPDGVPGAVMSSSDALGRSYTGTYTNPGPIEQNLEFYRRTLAVRGWDLVNSSPVAEGQRGSSLVFQHGLRELVLLFAPVKDGEIDRTLVTVALGGRNENS